MQNSHLFPFSIVDRPLVRVFRLVRSYVTVILRRVSCSKIRNSKSPTCNCLRACNKSNPSTVTFTKEKIAFSSTIHRNFDILLLRIYCFRYYAWYDVTKTKSWNLQRNQLWLFHRTASKYRLSITMLQLHLQVNVFRLFIRVVRIFNPKSANLIAVWTFRRFIKKRWTFYFMFKALRQTPCRFWQIDVASQLSYAV